MSNKTEKQTITATELKNSLGYYLDYVADDNEIVVTKNGKKIVRISPYITDYDRYFLLKEKVTDYSYGGKKVSYEEFMEIYENSDLRMEFINGEIIILGSPTLTHQEISGNLYVQFRDFLQGDDCKVFYSPFDVHFHKKGFKEPDVMQPDLLIACDTEENTNEKGKYMGTPTLVVEILSPSTRSKDMMDKLNTYTLSEVQEYWVIDPDKKLVLLYSFKDNDIKDFNTHKNVDKIVSQAFPDLEVALVDIFGE